MQRLSEQLATSPGIPKATKTEGFEKSPQLNVGMQPQQQNETQAASVQEPAECNKLLNVIKEGMQQDDSDRQQRAASQRGVGKQENVHSELQYNEGNGQHDVEKNVRGLPQDIWDGTIGSSCNLSDAVEALRDVEFVPYKDQKQVMDSSRERVSDSISSTLQKLSDMPKTRVHSQTHVLIDGIRRAVTKSRESCVWLIEHTEKVCLRLGQYCYDNDMRLKEIKEVSAWEEIKEVSAWEIRRRCNVSLEQVDAVKVWALFSCRRDKHRWSRKELRDFCKSWGVARNARKFPELSPRLPYNLKEKHEKLRAQFFPDKMLLESCEDASETVKKFIRAYRKTKEHMGKPETCDKDHCDCVVGRIRRMWSEFQNECWSEVRKICQQYNISFGPRDPKMCTQDELSSLCKNVDDSEKLCPDSALQRENFASDGQKDEDLSTTDADGFPLNIAGVDLDSSDWDLDDFAVTNAQESWPYVSQQTFAGGAAASAMILQNATHWYFGSHIRTMICDGQVSVSCPTAVFLAVYKFKKFPHLLHEFAHHLGLVFAWGIPSLDHECVEHIRTSNDAPPNCREYAFVPREYVDRADAQQWGLLEPNTVGVAVTHVFASQTGHTFQERRPLGVTHLSPEEIYKVMWGTAAQQSYSPVKYNCVHFCADVVKNLNHNSAKHKDFEPLDVVGPEYSRLADGVNGVLSTAEELKHGVTSVWDTVKESVDGAVQDICRTDATQSVWENYYGGGRK